MRFEKLASGLLVPDAKLIVGGRFHGEIFRDGVLVDEFDDVNIVTNQGLDYLLGAGFGVVSAIQSWYIGIFGNNYAPVATDTAATIAANSGEVTSYTGTTRQPYTPAEASQQVTNAANPANFTFTGGGNVYGAFVVSAGAQNATSGTLLAAAQFGTPKQVAAQDQLVLTYIFGAASA